MTQPLASISVLTLETSEVLELKRLPGNRWNIDPPETMTAVKHLYGIMNALEAEIAVPETHFESSLALQHAIRAMP